jgi:hypothetical protein
MTDILWLEKDSQGTLYDPETQSYVVMLPNLPDHVRLPAELGGQATRVIGSFQAQCPQRCGKQCTHYLLENDVYVGNCTVCKNPYGWYQRKG